MNPRTLALSLSLFVLTALGILVYVLVSSKPSGVPANEMIELETEDTPNLYSEFFIPEFTLIDRYNDPITHEVLDGQYTVVDFFFTSCPLWCPGMTQSMRLVQQATYGTDLRFMSISIDGDVDDPAALDQYAEAYGCDEERWDFATGDPEIVRTMVMEGLKFDLGDPSENEESGRLINHPTRLILLGPDRRVIGLYRYDDPDEVDRLIADAKRLVG